MTSRISCSVSILLFLIFGSCASPNSTDSAGSTPPITSEPVPTVSFISQVQPQQVAAGEWYYRILQNDIETGSMRVSFFDEGDSWIVEESTTLDLASIKEGIRTRLDKQSLRPIAHEVRGKIGSDTLDVSVRWEENKISGTSKFPRPAHKRQGKLLVDAILPDGTQERTASFYLLSSLDLEEGDEMKFHWFNGLYAQLDLIHLRVTGTVQKSVPAGTFECLRIELLGGDPSQIVYLSKERPRKVISIEVFDMPWKFELL